jgi:hypothetical protein
MLICPMCKKEVVESARACPRCRTDLSILSSYLGELQAGIRHAQSLTRTGELGEAVWAYLEVLEVEPDNAEARRQVGRVATAVRQFDRVAVGRRWLNRLRREAKIRRWLARWRLSVPNRWRLAEKLIIALLAFVIGYLVGKG